MILLVTAYTGIAEDGGEGEETSRVTHRVTHRVTANTSVSFACALSGRQSCWAPRHVLLMDAAS